MTTVGVDAYKPWRVDALRFPSYNYHYPHFKRKQLCSLIDRCRSQKPPDFRRTEVERMRQECECYQKECALPGTTKREKEALLRLESQDLKLPPLIPAKLPPDLLVRPHIRPSQYARWRFETTPAVTTQERAQWNHFLSRCPERFDIQLPLEDSWPGNLPYYDGGYALRFLRPHLTRGLGMERWKDTPFGTVPWPADNSPFRDIKVSSHLIGQ